MTVQDPPYGVFGWTDTEEGKGLFHERIEMLLAFLDTLGEKIDLFCHQPSVSFVIVSLHKYPTLGFQLVNGDGKTPLIMEDSILVPNHRFLINDHPVLDEIQLHQFSLESNAIPGGSRMESGEEKNAKSEKGNPLTNDPLFHDRSPFI